MKELPIEHAFKFCPRCAAKNEQAGSIPFRCLGCGFSHFFGPVAAVGALVTDESGKLLLVRRAHQPAKGRWGLPGGFVDRFETAEQAIAREVLEETDLRVTASEFLMTHPNRYNYRGIVAPVIDLFFRCQVAAGEITLADGELDDFVWTHPTADHLGQLAFESNRIAIERWMETKASPDH